MTNPSVKIRNEYGKFTIEVHASGETDSRFAHAVDEVIGKALRDIAVVPCLLKHFLEDDSVDCAEEGDTLAVSDFVVGINDLLVTTTVRFRARKAVSVKTIEAIRALITTPIVAIIGNDISKFLLSDSIDRGDTAIADIVKGHLNDKFGVADIQDVSPEDLARGIQGYRFEDLADAMRF